MSDIHLILEKIPPVNLWRLYNPLFPAQTVAYFDSVEDYLKDAEGRTGYTVTIEDKD